MSTSPSLAAVPCSGAIAKRTSRATEQRGSSSETTANEKAASPPRVTRQKMLRYAAGFDGSAKQASNSYSRLPQMLGLPPYEWPVPHSRIRACCSRRELAFVCVTVKYDKTHQNRREQGLTGKGMIMREQGQASAGSRCCGSDFTEM
jgi:hypothetical protein